MRTFLCWNKQSYKIVTVVQRQLTWRWKVRFRCNIVAIRYLWCFPCPVMWWQRNMINDVVCCEMFNGSQNQFFTSTQDNHSLRPVYACQLYAITHFSHISGKCAYRILFPHKSTSSTAIVIFLVFFYYQAISIGFVTSTIWLPIEWHRPCVRTPVEQDGVVGFKQFCAISATYLVFMRFA